MPSDLYMGTRYGVDTKNGFAMLLETAFRNKESRHSKTQSFCRPSEAYKAWYLSLSPRDALANDLKNLRRVLRSEGLYNENARESIRKCLHGWKDEKGVNERTENIFIINNCNKCYRSYLPDLFCCSISYPQHCGS